MEVALLDGLVRQGVVTPDEPNLTDVGRARMGAFGIELDALSQSRRPVCKACLDWSVRRSHLAGSLGAALLSRFHALGWSHRVAGTRIVAFSAVGREQFAAEFTQESVRKSSLFENKEAKKLYSLECTELLLRWGGVVHSATISPLPPNASGISRNFGNPSLIGSTVSP
jgi:hypothetical protein